MKNKTRDELEFGLKFEIPEDAPAGWGARTIQHREVLDYVPDRQDAFAKDEASGKVFMEVINRTGMRDAINVSYRKLYLEGKLQGNREGVEVLFEDEAIKVVADTRASYGYVYMAAWVKPSVQTTDLTGKDHPEFSNHENEEITRWTYHRVPEVGERLGMECNNIGEVLVVRYEKYCGWLHLVILPLDPPDWYLKQNWLAEVEQRDRIGRRRKPKRIGWKTCNMCGGEIRELEAA